MAKQKVFRNTITLSLEARHPHVLGEAEPRKEMVYSILMLLDKAADSKRTTFRVSQGGKRHKLAVNGLLMAHASSWKDAWLRLWLGIEAAAKGAKVPLEKILSLPTVSYDQWMAYTKVYNEGSDCGKSWAFSESDFALFLSVAREGKNHKASPNKCSGTLARSVYAHLCGFAGAGPKKKTTTPRGDRTYSAEVAERIWRSMSGNLEEAK